MAGVSGTSSDVRHSQLHGSKRPAHSSTHEEQPTKRVRALLDDDASDEETTLLKTKLVVPKQHEKSTTDDYNFKINQNYARRFEHNKKREELHKRAQIHTRLRIS